ncbi:MAG TPA: TetR/AcrR family transcriptional regulator [Planctomycetaceae bacterium]|nr:TetR/AcrR family transcriptional regulator [Planctomycetaceae bacterium]
MEAQVSTPIAEEILQAAVGLFARKGFEATSTREIVEAAGVTKPMLYYYFKSKEGLCEAVLTRFLSPFYARLRAVIDEPRPPRDALVEVVWCHLDYCRANRDFAKFFYSVFFGPDENPLYTVILESTRRGSELVHESAAKSAAAGLIDAAKIEALETALNAMINFWVILTIKEEPEVTREVAVQIVDLLLDGLAR